MEKQNLMEDGLLLYVLSSVYIIVAFALCFLELSQKEQVWHRCGRQTK
jgi:hypothetical protein